MLGENHKYLLLLASICLWLSGVFLHVLFIFSLMSQPLIEQCSKVIPINQFLSVLPLFLQELKSADLRNYSPARAGEKEHERKRISKVISSVQFSHSVLFNSLWPHESQHARPPCPSPSPRVHSDSRPSSLWCHPATSSSVVSFSSRPQSLPASESFPMSELKVAKVLEFQL